MNWRIAMSSTSCDALIIVFAKAPRAGEVKTRLIPLLGAEGAAALHRQLVHRTLVTATNAGLGPVELHGAPDDHDAFLRDCGRRFGIALLPQQGDDLGARLCRAFEEALARHARVIIIGTDCPALTEQHLRDAQAALAAGNDAVLVPAEDGGYALIGLAQCDASLFQGVAWGGATVLAATRERLKTLGWRWRELETLWDIDRPEDYRRWSALAVDHDIPPRA
jgi:rSAM/selenodomain-associated transferase 1